MELEKRLERALSGPERVHLEKLRRESASERWIGSEHLAVVREEAEQLARKATNTSTPLPLDQLIELGEKEYARETAQLVKAQRTPFVVEATPYDRPVFWQQLKELPRTIGEAYKTLYTTPPEYRRKDEGAARFYENGIPWTLAYIGAAYIGTGTGGGGAFFGAIVVGVMINAIPIAPLTGLIANAPILGTINTLRGTRAQRDARKEYDKTIAPKLAETYATAWSTVVAEHKAAYEQTEGKKTIPHPKPDSPGLLGFVE